MNLAEATFVAKEGDLKPIYSRNPQGVKRITLAEIPTDCGQNFESYGFRMEGEVVLFNLKDTNGNPILELGKTAQNQTRDSVFVACTRILPDGTTQESRFNMNAAIQTDITLSGYGSGWEKMRNGFSNHGERIAYLFSKAKPIALRCTKISKKTFTKFINGQRSNETEQRNYAEYEIVEQQ